MKTSILAWDTSIFGYLVGKIDCREDNTISKTELRKALTAFKRKRVRLVYGHFRPDQVVMVDVVSEFEGALVDKKIQYRVELPTASSPSTSSLEIISVLHQEMSSTLRSLALQSGINSRFLIDPHFTQGEYEKLYSLWLERSLKGEIAKDVLVAKKDRVCIGIITLGEKLSCGNIGLLAVDEQSRGQSVGRVLVAAALRRFELWGFRCVTVVTQLDNTPACHFYEGMGFRQDKIEHVYHFWL